MVLILKLHSKLLSHFGINIQILYTFGIYVKNGENILYIVLFHKEGEDIDKGRKDYYTPDVCIQERYMYGVVV